MQTSATQIPPMTPEAIDALAQEHFHAGRFLKALAALDLADEARPPTPASVKLRTLALLKSQQPQEAAKYLPQLLQVDRDTETWLRGIGRISSQLEVWDVAAETWSKVHALNPTNEEYLRKLLRARAQLGQHQLMLPLCEALAALGSDDDEVLRLAAQARVHLGHLPRVVEIVRKLLERDRDSAVEWLEAHEGPWWLLIRAQLLSPEDADASKLTLRCASGCWLPASPAGWMPNPEVTGWPPMGVSRRQR